MKFKITPPSSSQTCKQAKAGVLQSKALGSIGIKWWHGCSAVVLAGGLFIGGSVSAQSPNSVALSSALDLVDPLDANQVDPNDTVLQNLLIDLKTAVAGQSIDLDRYNPGGAYATLSSVAMKRAMVVTAALDAHLENLAAAAGGSSVSFGVRPTPPMLTPSNNTAAPSSLDWTVWTAGYGSRGTLDADASGGFERTRSKDYGASVGIEHQIGNLRIGVFGALGQTDTDFGTNLKVKADTWNVGGYGSVALGSVTVDATAVWGASDNKSSRETVTGSASGKFTSNDAQLGLGVAVNLLEPSSAWQITPVARVKYIEYSQDAFSETATGTIGFDTDKVSESTVVSKVGLRVARRGEISKGLAFGVDAGAFWIHDFNAEGKPVGLSLTGVSNSSFNATGRKSDADSAQFTLGVQATVSESVTLRLSGQQDYGSNHTQSTGLLSVGYSF